MPELETVTSPKVKPDLNPVYGIRFREGRKVAKVGPLAIATALGVSAQTILQFETGKQRLDIERFVAACDTVGLNVRWVLKGLGEMFEESAPAPKGGRPARRRAGSTPAASE